MGAGIRGLGPGYRSCVMHHPVDKDRWLHGVLGHGRQLRWWKNWTHVSDSAHYVARFAPSGRTLWLAGKGHVECQPWPPIVNPHERQRTTETTLNDFEKTFATSLGLTSHAP